jgi:hypothetical protein
MCIAASLIKYYFTRLVAIHISLKVESYNKSKRLSIFFLSIYQDIEDLDFQTDTTSMASRWSGFAHPHLDVTYKISIGSTYGGGAPEG